MARSALAACWIGAALLCVAVLAGANFMRPQMNWDLLAYTALVREAQGAAPDQAHDDAYADSRQLAESRGLQARWDALLQGSYRSAMVTDPAAFAEQLPFYRGRWLYVAVIRAVSLLTPTIGDAVAAVSALCSLAFCLLLLAFAVPRIGAPAASALTLLLDLAPTTTEVATAASPDALATLIVGGAAASMLAGRLRVAAVLFAAVVLVRTDLAILNLCIAAALVLLDRRRLDLPALGLLVASAGLAKLADLLAGGYGYLALYHFTFIEAYVPHPATLRGLPVPPAVFVRNFAAGVRYAIDNGGLWLVLAMLALTTAIAARMPLGRRVPETALLLAVAAQSLGRFLLFPEPDLRFATPEVAVLTLSLAQLAGRFRPLPR